MSKKPYNSKCSVKYCTNHYSTDSSYFTLPKDLKRRAIWIANCGLEWIDKAKLNSQLRICQKHFENQMFLNINRKNRLTYFAIPTIFEDQKSNSELFEAVNLPYIKPEPLDSLLMQTGPSDLTFQTERVDSYAQTPLYLTDNTPTSLKLKKELQLANKHIKDLEKTVKNLNYSLVQNNSDEYLLYYCKQFLPKNLVLIVQYYLMSKHRKKEGFRYTKQMKYFASSIYYSSPKVYHFLQSKLPLPNKSTLKRAKLTN